MDKDTIVWGVLGCARINDKVVPPMTRAAACRAEKTATGPTAMAGRVGSARAATTRRSSASLAAVARRGGKDLPLGETRADLRSDEWYEIAAGKGVLVLAELRAVMGDGPFESFLDEFGRGHAGCAVDTAAFFQAAEKAHSKPLASLAVC